MELLSNSILKQHINFEGSTNVQSQRFGTNLNLNLNFGLITNNEKFDIIRDTIMITNSDLELIFEDILKNKKIETNYYFLRKLFMNHQFGCTDQILRTVVLVIEKKINIISQTIKSSNLHIVIYNQIWTDYVEFNKQIYNILKIYKEDLTTKTISVGRMFFSPIEIIQLCMFYKKILKDSEEKFLALDESILKTNFDQKNICQLIDYVSSLRIFIQMQNFTDVNATVIIKIITIIMHRVNIINELCLCVHNILLDLNFQRIGNKIMSTHPHTINLSQTYRKTKNFLHKIVSLLSIYSNKNILLICYRKFMQARITNPSYKDFATEINLIRCISGLIGKPDSQKLLNSISDIIYSRSFTKNLSNPTINPIILTKINWHIINVSDMNITYPPRIKYCLDHISKIYSNVNNNKSYIQWQPTLGSAKFKAILGSVTVNITCNFLQAILLEYLNINSVTNPREFSLFTRIPIKLSDKIFESLLDANIIIRSSTLTLNHLNTSIKPNLMYIINKNNYTGDTSVDLKQTFIDTFVIEPDIDEL